MPESDLLLTRMRNRVEREREEGDTAYFYGLSLLGEHLTKVVTAGVIACIGEDADRHRYASEHAMVRTSALGDWSKKLNDVLTGPAAQFFLPETRSLIGELTARVGRDDWRYEAVALLIEVADALSVRCDPISGKAAFRQYFPIFATLRNQTRGHGAVTGGQCSNVCEPLARSLDLIMDNLRLLSTSWAHLRRNLSGKYRVTPLLGGCSEFDYLKGTRDVAIPNGTYLYCERLLPVRLVFSDADATDVFLPNGNYRNQTFDTLSYVTNQTRREDASNWTLPPHRLPKSQTEGQPALDQVGNCFANLPPQFRGYVERRSIEDELLRHLEDQERHPIITLTGRGGIGKTSLALAVLSRLVHQDKPPYEVIVWLSARDIDLLETGAKPVTPRVVNQDQMARVIGDLLEPPEASVKGFDPLEFFQHSLEQGVAGPTLFVVDNFETVESTADVFRWFDTYTRLPNKVLITTRFRDFSGDFPILVAGMTDEEARELIEKGAARLGVTDLLTTEYRTELMRESDAHPYVMKIMLGEVAASRKALKPERVIASKDEILRAMFERTYANLSPGAKRIFLLLSSWRVLVPEAAIEAVSLRPSNERFDVQQALEELRRFSMVDEVISEVDQQPFLGVPLAASIFGRKKLSVSHLKVSVEADRKLLMEFGAGKREDVQRGVFPRIERLVSSIARRASDGDVMIDDAMPVLEFLAARVPRTWLALADLYLELDSAPSGLKQSRTCVERYLESVAESEREPAWWKLADLCLKSDDLTGEIHALSEIALLRKSDIQAISGIANRVNNRLRELRSRGVVGAWPPEVVSLIEQLILVFDARLDDADATDCSRLAWLHLNLQREDRARDIARVGITKDPTNIHCRNLLDRLADQGC